MVVVLNKCSIITKKHFIFVAIATNHTSCVVLEKMASLTQ